MKLITIPISHFCEKARWALDRANLAYVEEQHLQLFHMLPVWRARGKRTTPVLVTADAVYPDSHCILKFADSVSPAELRLYPDNHEQRREVLQLENAWDRRYGVDTRLIGYDVFFSMGRSMLGANDGHAPRWERLALRAMFPVGKRFMVSRLKVTPKRVQRAKDTVAQEMDKVAERLSDGRRYLTGDQFTAADLTFAALSAPLFGVDGYGAELPDWRQLPGELHDMVAAYREHPAAKFVQRIYDDERR